MRCAATLQVCVNGRCEGSAKATIKAEVAESSIAYVREKVELERGEMLKQRKFPHTTHRRMKTLLWNSSVYLCRLLISYRYELQLAIQQ